MIKTRLAEYPKLSATGLYEEIRAAGYAGGYTQVSRCRISWYQLSTRHFHTSTAPSAFRAAVQSCNLRAAGLRFCAATRTERLKSYPLSYPLVRPGRLEVSTLRPH